MTPVTCKEDNRRGAQARGHVLINIETCQMNERGRRGKPLNTIHTMSRNVRCPLNKLEFLQTIHYHQSYDLKSHRILAEKSNDLLFKLVK